MQQRCGFELTAAPRHAKLQRMCAGRDRIFIAMNDQPRSDFFTKPIAEFDHLFKFVTGVYVKKRKRERARIESLSGEVNENARVLPNGIQQHRVSELRNGFPQDVY